MVRLQTKDYNNANLDRSARRRERAPIHRAYAVVRRLRIVAAAVLGCAVLAAGWVPTALRPTAASVQPEAAPATLITLDPAVRTFQRFALNALVFPLIDHESQPPRWTRHAVDWICDGRGDVAIDGKPLVEGAPVSLRKFIVRWNFQRCAPLDGAELLIDGQIELIVSHHGADLRAWIVAPSLWVETPAGRHRLPANDDAASGSFAQAAP